MGSAADAFARQSGVTIVPNEYFSTASKVARWEAKVGKALERSEDFETVGATALDIHGGLAAAGSTGGLNCKMNGRIGDTAIFGAGLSVDRTVAVVWLVSLLIIPLSIPWTC